MRRLLGLIVLSFIPLVCFASDIQSCKLSLLEQPILVDVSQLGYTWESFDRYSEFDFSDRRKVLFLSDGGVSSKVPLQKQSRVFVGSDLSPKANVQVRLNNTQLPFSPASFDLIVMNRGLCLCHSIKKTCGGVNLNKSSVRDFLESVAGLLDPRNPTSMALLTGYYGNSEAIAKVPDLFRSQLGILKKNFPNFEFVELIDPTLGDHAAGEFIGIAIYQKGTSLQLNLRDLELPR